MTSGEISHVKCYVALFDCDWLNEFYRRGEIVGVAKDGVVPPGIVWVSFDPPDLDGVPTLANIHDDGRGNLIFRYAIEGSQIGFEVRCRVGLPTGTVIVVTGGPGAAGDPVLPETEIKPVLRSGAGLVTTDSRGYICWAPEGTRPAAAEVEEEFDRLDPPDWWWARGGFE